MGNENIETVEEIREEATQLVETEEAESSNKCGFKQVAVVATATTVMLGAAYGLARLGGVVWRKGKQLWSDHKEKITAQEELDDFDDDFDGDTVVDSKKK